MKHDYVGVVVGDSSILEQGLASWLYTQGVSTVLLFLILIAIWRAYWHAVNKAIPEHLDKIQDGYERIQSSHERQVVNLTSTFQRERELEREVVKETTIAIRELTEELRANHLK